MKLEARAQFERGSDGAYRAGRPDVDRALNRIGAQAVAPVFPGGQGKNLEIRQRYGLDRYYKIRLRPGADARAAAAEMRKSQGVELATEGGAKTLNVESATGATAEVVPNDPSFNLQWALQNTGVDPGGALGIPLEADADIDATDAWSLTTGSSAVTVALISTGIDFAEPQLAGRFWENAVEAAGLPGVDDDGNGYIDDVRGWDWIEGDNNPAHTPDDPLNPNQVSLDQTATRLASIIGANGNDNTGLAGIDWASRFVSIRALSGTFFATFAECMSSYLYAADLGARVIISNVAFFDLTPEELTLITDTIAATQAMGAVVVGPAGSAAADGINTLLYPAALPGVLGVAGTEGQDLHCDMARCGYWSTTGFSVALTAPGRRILMVNPVAGGGPGELGYLNGTGTAAAVVAGVAALAFAANPALTAEQTSLIVKYTADDQVGDPTEDTPGRDDYTGFGRVNAHRAVQWAMNPPASLTPPGVIRITPSAVSVAENAGSVSLTLSRIGGAGGSVSVSWWTANGTALNGVDYANYFTPEQLIVTWADGDGADKTVSVPLIDNTLYDGDRTFTIGIASPTGGATLDPTNSQSVVTIQNEDVDDPPTVSAPSVVEGMETVALSFAVSASDPDGDTITSLTTTALPAGATFTPAPDNSSGLFEWTPAGGLAGTYIVWFTAVSGPTALSGSAMTEIHVTPYSQPPVVTAPAAVSSPAGITMSFGVTATDPDGDIIQQLVAGGLLKTGATFTTSGVGTPTATGTFTWTPNFAQSRTFTFTATNGCGNQSCFFSTTATTVVTVTAGAPTLSLSAANYNVNETGGTATITVTRGVSSAGTVTVDYATTDGTALNGTDYTGVSGTLTFPDGSSLARTFTVPILDDGVKEGNRVFNVVLSNPTAGVALNRSSATVTILDNESSPGALTLSASEYSVSETAGTVAISVNRVGGSDGAVSVNYATNEFFWSEALNGLHYMNVAGTLTWADGDAAPKSFLVPIIDNSAIVEGDLRFRVTISTATGGAILMPPSAADVTILDSGGVSPQLSVTPLAHDFGPVGLGSSGTVAVTVQNVGGGTLNVSIPTLTSGAAEGFSLSGELPLSLGAGASESFFVTFQPTTLGSVAGTVSVSSDGGGATVALSGTGVDTTLPSVAVTNPAGGETYSAGASVLIEWTASDNHQLQSFDLEYSTDGGATFPNAIASTAGADRSYAWTVPSLASAASAAVRVTARDAAGNASAATSNLFTILGSNAPATIDAIAHATVAEGATATVPVHAIDAEGDPISLTAALPAFATLDAPTTGNGDVSTTITLSPGFSDAGSYPAAVSEAGGASVSFGITVSNTDQGLTLAAPASVSAAERSLFTVDVSASDPDGEPVASLSADLSALPVGNDAAFAIVGDPLPAALAQGQLTWTPDCHMAGSYAVVFTAVSGNTATATTTIDVANVGSTPDISPIADQTVAEGDVLAVPVVAADAEGDPITLAATLPAFGSFVDNGGGSGSITLAPGFEDAGSYSAEVTASESCDGSATSTFAISVTNTDRSVALDPIADLNVAEGAVGSTPLNASDPDGETITLSLLAAPLFASLTDNGDGTGSVTAAPGYDDAGAHPAIAAASTAGSFDNESFTIHVANTDRPVDLAAIANQTVAEGASATVTLAASDPDNDPITYSATLPDFGSIAGNEITLAPGYSDAGTYPATATASTAGSSDTESFGIDVTNTDRPVALTAPASAAATEGVPFSMTVLAHDEDGDAIALTADLSGLPAGNDAEFSDAAINALEREGTLTWTPTYDDAGSHVVSFAATAGPATATATTTIAVANVNRAPTVSAPANQSVSEGATLAFSVSASDPDGAAALTLAADLSDLPSGPTFADNGDNTGSFNWATTYSDAAGSPYFAIFSASDGTDAGSATTQIAVLDVAAATAFPTSKGALRLGAGKPNYFVAIEPVGGSFLLTDVEWSTVRMNSAGTGTVSSIAIDATKPVVVGDQDGNSVNDATVNFAKSDLRNLFSLVSGRQMVPVTITGSLTGGTTFIASMTIEVVGTGSMLAASVSPNPLNPEAVLTFQIRTPGHVRATLHDVQGRLVRRLTDETMSTGWHDVRVDGRDDRGRALRSGVYFYRLETRDGVETGQLTILK